MKRRSFSVVDCHFTVAKSLNIFRRFNIMYFSHKIYLNISKQSKKEDKIRNRYDQAPHLTQDTNGKLTMSQLDITNESQEVSPLPEGDHKASANRRG